MPALGGEEERKKERKKEGKKEGRKERGRKILHNKVLSRY
jgi:hypothetical protein